MATYSGNSLQVSGGDSDSISVNTSGTNILTNGANEYAELTILSVTAASNDLIVRIDGTNIATYLSPASAAVQFQTVTIVIPPSVTVNLRSNSGSATVGYSYVQFENN